MSSRESIYLSGGTDVSEVERAVRLCLRADWAAVPEATLPDTWQAWLKQGTWEQMARHVTRVYQLSAGRELAEIVQADRNLRQGLVSTYAAAEEVPGTNDPLRKNLLRAAQEERMPGHLATFCAVAAQQAFLPLLVALQSAFFLEWRARQQRLQDATVNHFVLATVNFCQQLHSFLKTHESSAKPRFGSR
jgi:hypothetical protein